MFAFLKIENAFPKNHSQIVHIYVQWSCYQGDRRKPHKQALVLLAIDYIALISRERNIVQFALFNPSMIHTSAVCDVGKGSAGGW